ncbi:Ff.00g020660.m01.CDS01 [Fusarium sp. VM40]|nr:Ff.00g020660.m01.CDS01 [Fusarium sp. VM40]
MLTSPFTVIIVGGGPVGLLTAHALHQAGIDFVVLEQRSDIFEDAGASLIGFDARKHRFSRSYALSILQENHGSSLVAFHRAELVRALYDNLPEDVKSRYLLGKKLTSAVATSTGIDVVCADGHSYSASIIIGADGAHSKTRSIMRSCALQNDPSLASVWDPENPFTSTYKCLWASFRRPSEPGDSYETQGQDRSLMYLTGRNKGWIFLYEKLDQPSNERCLYDKGAIQSFKDTFADWPLTEKLTVKDVLQDPDVIGGMTNLEEGVVGKVSWNGRIVLVGDAWHKFTPNSGLGFNNGIQDVVSLCNKLRALICIEDKPDATALETIFDEYQVERCEPLRGDYLRSAQATRLSTWATRMDYLLGRYIYSIPYIQRYLTANYTSPKISQGLILDYISAPEPFLGKAPWKYPMNSNPQKIE